MVKNDVAVEELFNSLIYGFGELVAAVGGLMLALSLVMFFIRIVVGIVTGDMDPKDTSYNMIMSCTLSLVIMMVGVWMQMVAV